MIHRVAEMSDETSPCPSRVAAVSDGSGDLFSLRGRRALVTGAGQGIGFALARGLGAAGAELLLNDVDPARLEQAVATLRGEGLVVHGRCFDVTNGADVERSVAEFDRFICARTPAGRWGEPRELIGTAVFLASRASDFVNGQILYVDGGLLAAL